jgi:lysophospholipase L1-like esterase
MRLFCCLLATLCCAQTVSDWPKLGRYRAENAQTPPPAPHEQRVVFLGDSITDAWGRSVGEFFPGKPYLNRGIGGQTTPQMLLRFRFDVVALRPAAVVILAGTNDIAGHTGPASIEEIGGNLASMAELATVHGIRAVLCSVLPVNGYQRPRPASRPIARIRALNDWIRQYAEQHGHVYLDYFSAMLDEAGMLRRELSEDGLHPNEAGYAVMAPLAEAAIRRALAR